MARRESIGVVGGQQVEPGPAEQGGAGPAAHGGAGPARPSEAPPDQWEASVQTEGRVEDPGISERQASQGVRGGDEPVESNLPADQPGAPLAAANGTTVGPASGDPTAAAPSIGGVEDPTQRPDAAAATDEAATEVPPGTGSNVGWFSTEGSASPYAGALSEQLSAERPTDEPDRSSRQEGSAGGGSSHVGIGLTPTPGEHRSPELIESGMVHVDPDPEIGSPPGTEGSETTRHTAATDDPGATRAAAATEGLEGFRVPAGYGGSAGTEDPTRSEAPTAQAANATDHDRGGHAVAGDAAGATVPADSFSPSAASGDELIARSPDSAEEISTGQGPRESSPDDPEPALGNTSPADVAGSRVAGTPHDPNGEQVPWDEPTLPVAWSPGVEPPTRPERPRLSYEDSSDDELQPQPDPTWPRLFGRTAGDLDARETGEPASSDLPRESIGESVGEAELPGPLEGSRSPIPLPAFADAAGHRPTTGEMVSPVEPQASGREEFSGESDLDPSKPKVDTSSQATSEEPETTSPRPASSAAVVDLTTTDRPEVPDGTPEPARPPEQTASPRGLRSGVDETTTLEADDATTPASISTATRSETAEVDLRDTSTSPPGVDVSRETFAGGGEGMEEEREDEAAEDEAAEDEAAIAVREAVTRAAAEAGVDVSRETEQFGPGPPADELGQEPSIDAEAAARSARVTFRVHRDSLNGTRRVVAVANQKGGVGKSTTAVNIGAYLALAGARVLVVDLDPQGNASTGLGLDHRDIEPSIYDVLTGEAAPTSAIRATGVANLHVLPSTIDLAGAEVELVSAMSRETRLRRALQSVDHQYDTILIDCPPSLGLLTVNALAAADELLIPIQCEYYALEGLGQLLRNVELVRANLNPDLRVGGIVLTMYDGRTRLALQVVDEVRRHFTDLVYQTVVPRSVRLSEAPGYGVPIALYDPLSRGGIAYRDLTFELAERSGLLAPTGEGAS